jgi:hypothetical protein
MRWSTLILATAALSLAAPVASYAQTAQSAPPAGGASTGSGGTAMDNAAPTTTAPKTMKKKHKTSAHMKTKTTHAAKTKAM